MTITQERLKQVLRYEPDTGLFVWTAKTGTKSAGSVAGSLHNDRYICIQIDRRIYRAHQLAWLYMTGEWPKDEIDHKNTIGNDNSWGNLRLATHEQNMQNQRRAHKNNLSSGLLGVSKQGSRFRARIWAGGYNKCLGLYESAQEAHDVYVAAKRQIHQGNTL